MIIAHMLLLIAQFYFISFTVEGFVWEKLYTHRQCVTGLVALGILGVQFARALSALILHKDLTPLPLPLAVPMLAYWILLMTWWDSYLQAVKRYVAAERRGKS